MAQFECRICGAGFEQKSAYERHLQTSHPEQAPSAADIERALQGVEFPARRGELVQRVRGRNGDGLADILAELPEREFRDAAEVARAFGELRSGERKPGHQPSERGGRQALKAPSAARIASLLEGVRFPASARDLREHARGRADAEALRLLERLPEGTYAGMSEVAKGLGAATRGEEAS